MADDQELYPCSKWQIDWIIDDQPHEECGVIGIFAPNEDVARMAFFGLYALQHRGQEAAGIAVSDGRTARLHKDMGLVSQVSTRKPGAADAATTPSATRAIPPPARRPLRNAQPFMIETQYGPLAVAHNGNLVNAAELRQDLLRRGVGLSSSSDSEVMTMMLAGAEGATWEERIHRHCMPLWRGAYSLVILTRDAASLRCATRGASAR